MANAREAPRFLSDFTGFNNFFRDVEELGRRAGITELNKIDWAVRYANSEADTWMRGFDRNDANATLSTFKDAVRKRYPQLSTDHRYTIRDLERIANRVRRFDDMTREDLGDYHRKFIDCSDYLLDQDEINRREESEIYLDGLPSYLRSRVLHRLSVKLPDVQPSRGYKIEDVHDAALFELDGFTDRGVRRGHRDLAEHRSPGSVDDFVQALTRVLSTTGHRQQPPLAAYPAPPPLPPRYPRPPTPGGVDHNAPRWNPQPTANSYDTRCVFCGSQSHYIRECPIATQYLQQGKVIRNSSGRLTLPDGRYPSRNVPGNNMRDKVDHLWNTGGIQNRDRANHDNRDRAPYQDTRPPHQDNRDRYREDRGEFRDNGDRFRNNRDRSRENQARDLNDRDRYRDDRDRNPRGPVSANFLETADECIFSLDVSSHHDNPRDYDSSDDGYMAEQAQILESKIASLQEAHALVLQGKKARFDGVEIPRRSGFPNPQ